MRWLYDFTVLVTPCRDSIDDPNTNTLLPQTDSTGCHRLTQFTFLLVIFIPLLPSLILLPVSSLKIRESFFARVRVDVLVRTEGGGEEFSVDNCVREGGVRGEAEDEQDINVYSRPTIIPNALLSQTNSIPQDRGMVLVGLRNENRMRGPPAVEHESLLGGEGGREN